MTRPEEEIALLKQRIETLTNLVNDRSDGTPVDFLKTKANEAGERLRQYVDDSGIKDRYNKIHDGVTHFESQIENEVQQKPIRTLLFAFLAGVAVSTFFGKRR